MSEFQVNFFRDDDGTKPVGQFIRSDGNQIIIATNGFVKKRQKTPRSEIDLAISRRSIYMSRKEREK